MPGDNIAIEVELITPIAMEKELRFAIREGGRTVGAGVVAEDHRVALQSIVDFVVVLVSSFMTCRGGGPEKRSLSLVPSLSRAVMPKGNRSIISLECPQCKRRNYSTTKNKRTTTDKLQFSKFCRKCKKQYVDVAGVPGSGWSCY